MSELDTHDLQTDQSNSAIDPITHAIQLLEGWCTERKARFLADLILQDKCQLAVEVGIFGGRSLIPIALAIRQTGGQVYGVEAWSNFVAVETPTNETNDTWWRSIDIAAIKKGFLTYLAASDLVGITRIIELPSLDAARAFAAPRFAGKIDFLHIDGGHSEQQALADVRTWLPLLRRGAIVVMDDIGWPSVQEARAYLKQNCETVSEIFERSDVAYGAYRVK